MEVKRGSFKYLCSIIQGDAEIDEGRNGGSHPEHCVIRRCHLNVKTSTTEWWLHWVKGKLIRMMLEVSKNCSLIYG